MIQIIHQIAEPKDSSKWLPVWKKCYESWRKVYPNFKFMTWDLNDLDNFVEKNYPDYLEQWSKLEYNVSKYDIGRYLLLYHYGGIYADMDLYCHKRFDDKLDSNVYFAEEVPVKFISSNGYQFANVVSSMGIHSNFLITSKVTFYIFWLQLVDFMFYKIDLLATEEYKRMRDSFHANDTNPISKLAGYILNTTGPYSIDHFMKLYGNNYDCKLLPYELFYVNLNPKYTEGQRIPINGKNEFDAIESDFNYGYKSFNRYTTHLESKSWNAEL